MMMMMMMMMMMVSNDRNYLNIYLYIIRVSGCVCVYA